MKLKINNREYEYKTPLTLEEISRDFEGSFYCAKVNHRLRELTYIIDKDTEIEFLDLSDKESMRVYQATLRYIIAMAMKNVFPGFNIRFSNSISMSLFAKIIKKNITPKELKVLENETRRLISLNLPLKREKYEIEEMVEYYKSLGYYDKIETLKYRKEKVNVYECDGYKNYMYNYMAPSTGYIKEFRFVPYYPGFMIQFPRSESSGTIPHFYDEPKFLKTLAQANRWASLSRSENIYEINEKINDYNSLVTFINLCETRHNHEIMMIGEEIEKNISDIRLVAIAGPSSSGKTTFSKRLEIELLSRNINPLRISLDNYYLPFEKTPIDEDGNPDFEDIEALNIELFNDNMRDFLDGREVMLPVYDFTTHLTSYTDPIKLHENDVIIIEGIHALNDRLTESIPKENKYKIYICPLPQRNIDNHNPISFTDIRLLRRLVRDKKFRNTDCLKTLEQWESVRRGERKWIYPYMESADFIFNSELGYELLLLKKYGIESLKEVPYDNPSFIQANRLIKFLKVYRSLNDDIVPNNSLLREFIGGSMFKDI